jgi:uncharacterized protein YwqG
MTAAAYRRDCDLGAVMRVPEVFIWPAISITVNEAELDLTIGQSRFGGEPDLPDDFVWPEWFEGRPLSFLAQINLREIVGIPCSLSLPVEGWLVFFYDAVEQPWGYDPTDRGGAHVTYIEAASQLVRRSPPGALPDDARFKACAVAFHPVRTYPDPDSLWIDVENTAEERGALYDEYDAVMSQNPSWHQIAGHPKVIQNPMELECQLVSNGLYCGSGNAYDSEQGLALAPGAFDWRCLLTIESDDAPGWMWGDGGNIYFWMREADIAARRFDRAWTILQCY